MSTESTLHIGFIEPHLRLYGGIRRVLEFGNRLAARGHSVTYYVPPDEPLSCDWMPVDGNIKHLQDGFDDQLDIIVFNHEPQWYLLDEFHNAERRVFYALHYSKLYEKGGSWESLHRAEVDAVLANSTWTADQIAAETGYPPTVILSGITPEYFHLVPDAVKRYPILSVGDRRPWKGQRTIDDAGELLGLPVEAYADKGLAQTEMAMEYAQADVFVVGSEFEGFGQPGIEALACGVPLVTTANGGSADYAIDGETALVVPAADPNAMAAAISRLRSDPKLRHKLISGGLEMVRNRFDWDRNVSLLEAELTSIRSQPPRRSPVSTGPAPTSDSPELSIVIPVWNQLHLTQECVESIRQTMTVPYELIVVDNGSDWLTARYIDAAADKPIRNETNLGFARAMNQGLAESSAPAVVFLNNDTVMPAGWDARLLETLQRERAGIVVPAITASNNVVTVRDSPGDDVRVLAPFSAPPAAVLYAMRREIVSGLGGWCEDYDLASGEDVDLGFTVWVNDLDIVFDERVLVRHVSKGTARHLDDWQSLWRRNRDQFLEKWSDENGDTVRLDGVDSATFRRNRMTAASVAGWMTSYFRTRSSLEESKRALAEARATERANRGDIRRGKAAEKKLNSLTNRKSVRMSLMAADFWGRARQKLRKDDQ